MAGPATVGGYPDYSSSGTIGYIPEVWSGRTVEKLYATTVFGEISSTDYEGEIKGYGDNVVIRTIPDVTVQDYVIGATFSQADYELPNSSSVELSINKAKSFKVRVNTVTRSQSDLDLPEVFANEASMKLKIAIDTDVIRNLDTDVSADNKGATAGVISDNLDLGVTGTPIAITATNAVSHILLLGQVLDEQNVGDEGRWLVLPSWYIRLLKSSDLKTASLTGDAMSPLRNGKVGMIDRFMVYQSNNLDQTSVRTNILAGHKAGLAFAAQITEMERLPNPWDFGHLMRGLCVYGYKVVEGKFLVSSFVDG